MNRKAMIMAAGLGTRMKPLTDSIPKALLKYQGKTLLQAVIERLVNYGFQNIIVNIHHHAGQVLEYLSENKNFGATITISDERDELLDTGGGLLKASTYFDSGAFLVHNVDISTNLDLNGLMNCHLKKGSIGTLAVKHRETSRSLLMDENQVLCGWRNNQTGEEIIVRGKEGLSPIAFSGIYVLDPEIFNYFEKTGSFPIMPELLRIAEQRDIWLYSHDKSTWKDLGKPASFDAE